MESFVLKWRESSERGETRWFIRGVNSNQIYGEVVFSPHEGSPGNKGARNVDLNLPSNKAKQLHELIAEVEAASDPLVLQQTQQLDWQGMIARGKPSEAKVIYRFSGRDKDQSSATAFFLGAVDLLRPYIESV